MTREQTHTVAFLWDAKVWIITWLFFIFSIGLIGWFVVLILSGSVVAGLLSLLIAVPIFAGLLIYCEGYSPQRLEISESRITILRRYDSITILRSAILEITPLTKQNMAWTINLGGCGGLFGYFGHFRNSYLGEFQMYATGDDNLFLIRLANGDKIVVQCSEPQIMV